MSNLLPDKDVFVQIGEIEYRVDFFDYSSINTTEKCLDCGTLMMTDQIAKVHEIINQDKMLLIPLNCPLAKRILKMANRQIFKDHLWCPKCFVKENQDLFD